MEKFESTELKVVIPESQSVVQKVRTLELKLISPKGQFHVPLSQDSTQHAVFHAIRSVSRAFSKQDWRGWTVHRQTKKNWPIYKSEPITRYLKLKKNGRVKT